MKLVMITSKVHYHLQPGLMPRKVVMYTDILTSVTQESTKMTLSIECLFQCSFFHKLTIFTSTPFFFSLSFVHKNNYIQCTYTSNNTTILLICRHAFSNFLTFFLHSLSRVKLSYDVLTTDICLI